MYRLGDEQIDFILNDLSNRGIRTEGLRQNLLDHICIMIEQELEEKGDFQQFYNSAIKKFYKNELLELEDETTFLLSFRGPHILLSRSQFFILLFCIFIGPFLAYFVSGIANADQTAGFHIPFEVWGASLVYAMFPLLILLVLFLTPEGLDPIIPRRAKVLLGVRPFIRIIPARTILHG
jgi:hypothetical protein